MNTGSKVTPEKIKDSTQTKQDATHQDYESTSYKGSEVSNKYGTANKEADIKNASASKTEPSAK